MKVIKCTIMQIYSWRKDPRAISSIILGIALSCFHGKSYLDFASFIRGDVQAFELFILNGSVGSSFMGIFLGNLLLMSNSPFTHDTCRYEIIRMGKCRWIDQKILYVVFGSIIYSMIILLSSIVLSSLCCNVLYTNDWSGTMKELALKQPFYATTSFRLSFPYKEYINSVSPYLAMFLTVATNTLYSIIICIIILCVNLMGSQNRGWLIASCFHVFGYIVYANGGFWLLYKFSLFCRAITAFYFTPEMQISFSSTFLLFSLLIGGLREMCHFISRYVEY